MSSSVKRISNEDIVSKIIERNMWPRMMLGVAERMKFMFMWQGVGNSIMKILHHLRNVSQQTQIGTTLYWRQMDAT